MEISIINQMLIAKTLSVSGSITYMMIQRNEKRD
jgi:hypothetical protein